MKTLGFVLVCLIGLVACHHDNAPVAGAPVVNDASAVAPAPRAVTPTGGDVTGNGGGENSLLFSIIGKLIGLEFETLLKRNHVGPLTPELLEKFRRAVQESRVIMTNDKLFDRFGAPADLVTEDDPERPGKKIIRVNEPAFRNQLRNGTVFITVCHEYYRAAGIYDDQAKTLANYHTVLTQLNEGYLRDANRLKGLAVGAGEKGPMRSNVFTPFFENFCAATGIEVTKARLRGNQWEAALQELLKTADEYGLILGELDIYLNSLRSSRREKRDSAARAIEKFPGRSSQHALMARMAIPFLILKLNDPDVVVADSVGRALGAMDETAVTKLQQALQHPSADVVMRVMRALAAIGSASDVATKSIVATGFGFWGTDRWGEVESAMNSALTQINGVESQKALRVLPGLLVEVAKKDLAKRQESVFRHKAETTGIPFEEVVATWRNNQVERSGVIGLKSNAPVPSDPNSLNGDLGLYTWDYYLNIPVWTRDESVSRASARKMPWVSTQQIWAHYLLSFYSGGGAVPLPEMSEANLPDFRHPRHASLYIWDPGEGAQFWSQTMDEHIGAHGHYFRQAYMYYLLASCGAHGRLSLPKPPRPNVGIGEFLATPAEMPVN
jgi:hypothetical protein